MYESTRRILLSKYYLWTSFKCINQMYQRNEELMIHVQRYLVITMLSQQIKDVIFTYISLLFFSNMLQNCPGWKYSLYTLETLGNVAKPIATGNCWYYIGKSVPFFRRFKEGVNKNGFSSKLTSSFTRFAQLRPSQHAHRHECYKFYSENEILISSTHLSVARLTESFNSNLVVMELFTTHPAYIHTVFNTSNPFHWKYLVYRLPPSVCKFLSFTLSISIQTPPTPYK